MPYNCAEIPLIVTRHEQATVFMADGYARSTGEPGVAVVTNGPGRTNALTAILNAYSDSVPLVVLFGHTAFKFLGKGMLQEKPYLDSFAPYAKWTFSIPSPDRVPDAFRRAFTIARSGRPGPVILEIPEDILTGEIERTPYAKTRRVRFGPDLGDVDRALELIRESHHPLVYAGRGALYSGATELRSFVETYSVPFMTSLMAKGTIPEDHPLCLGLGGYPRAMYSTQLAQKYAEEADLVLALGCSFPQLATSIFCLSHRRAVLFRTSHGTSELPSGVNCLSDVKLCCRLSVRPRVLVSGERSGKIGHRGVGESKQWRIMKPRLTG
jgi:acetolactate synthase-1/2/3 large subunit